MQNAINNTYEKGKISLKVEYIEQLQVSIQDTGVGIRKQDQPKLFKFLSSQYTDDQNQVYTG